MNAEYSVHSGVILRGIRVVIPKVLRPSILKELHSTHIGMVKMKSIARSLCYWPKIDEDIENIFKYRDTPLECGKIPAELYLKIKFRTRLDLIKPQMREIKTDQQCHKIRELQLGDRVQSRNYTSSGL